MTLSTREIRLLSELSKNSREQQRTIAKRMRISPQTLKYNLDSLRENQVFTEHAIIDPARLGLITIRAFLSFTTFNKHTQEDIINELCEEPDVVLVQRLRLGADVLVEYAVPNLSYFNKAHTAFLHRNNDAVRNKRTYPVLVRYAFERTYLHKRATQRSMILSGDREAAQTSDVEDAVLQALINDPSASSAQLARETGHDPRTVRRALNACEQEKIIRGYSIDIDYEQANINCALLGVQFSYVTKDEMKRFVEFANQTQEIVGLAKVIGPESVFVTIETFESYTTVIERLRAHFEIIEYSVFEAGNVVKNTGVPSEAR